MPLAENDLQDVNKVFGELKRQYGQKRIWTAADLIYAAPPDAWLAPTRPQRARSGAPTPATYKVVAEGGVPPTGRLTVTIIGFNLTTQKEVKYTAGSILDK
jgi:hypothetical protein